MLVTVEGRCLHVTDSSYQLLSNRRAGHGGRTMFTFTDSSYQLLSNTRAGHGGRTMFTCYGLVVSALE